MKALGMKSVALLAGIVLSATAYADDVLPKEMKGNISRPTGRYNVSWSIIVESQDPNGDIKGRFNFDGRSCRVEGLAFTGTYRDGALQLNVPAASVPAGSPSCGPWDIKLKRSGASGYEFNGLSTESTNSPADAYLKGG
jgi:hypothetical protein